MELEDLARKQCIAEEAVRIVRGMKVSKTKREQNEDLVELCTEFARILDENGRYGTI